MPDVSKATEAREMVAPGPMGIAWSFALTGAIGSLAALTLPVHWIVSTSCALLFGLLLGFILASKLVLEPRRRSVADRAWLVQSLRELARANREQEFSILLEGKHSPEIEELARACHEALLSAHRDRLEAAALRREMESRVEKRTRVAVAHLSRITQTDDLTGLSNRRGFEQNLNEAWIHTTTHGTELAMLAIDLDKFKQLNDTCGHDAGDSALRAVGEVFRANMRDGDFAGRIGGDEMIICLQGTGSKAAQAVAERLMALYAQHPAGVGMDAPWPTMSIGIACAREHGATSPHHLRQIADDALYEAKRAGRARCSIASPAAKGKNSAA